ncbi:hypothetical protein [Hephaestia mangrovi]|uniref:hypothetical protein n=1 Tax=Hephaestia mangrovi TaxID=2873268 RepID=UPI001CA63374|nr:hypothetical protein [Hephaestia mangrovi]MBY8827899.1 hypothetical protein [Hephaestia mangrovi]
MSEDTPRWDQQAANRLDGSVVLVGITYKEPGGDRLDQFFGTVVNVDQSDGITLRLEGSRTGEQFRLPPDLRAFFPAKPGSYHLKGTGDVVNDPDFTTTWTMTPPSN